jgi:hypothetical protein
MIANSHSKKLCGKFTSCAVIFESRQERDDFIANQKHLLPESSAFKLNIWETFVEIIMPESFLHAQVDYGLFDCCIETLLSQCYIPGTHRFDTGIVQGGSASISPYLIVFNL